jgi:hypothetical protein
MIIQKNWYCNILKLGESRDINSILREYSIEVSKEQLLYMCNKATKDKFNTLIINLDKSGNQRY